MEISSILILLVSCVISFALGRMLVSNRNNKRELKRQADEAEALRNRPAEKASLNKAKRKRQLQQEEKARR